jgi:CMP-N-acetylneuraminic acid synthetase
MKKINDICVVVQARLGSQRVPKKMIRKFNDTTLVDLLFSKLIRSKIIPKSNIYFSAYEEELKDISKKYGINVFDRSKESAYAEMDMKLIYEWHDKLPFKYVVLISACNPLLKIETIDSFLKSFMETDKDGSFAVFEKKTYYWDKNRKPITNWNGASIMNTKVVEPIYEAAHCLYASRLDIIRDGFWMDMKSPPEPELFIMEEIEAFDIDYEWQFKLAEKLTVIFQNDRNF